MSIAALNDDDDKWLLQIQNSSQQSLLDTLRRSILFGDLWKVEVLIERGVDIHHDNGFFLLAAIRAKQNTVAAFLFAKGGDRTMDKTEALSVAVSVNNIEMVKRFLDAGVSPTTNDNVSLRTAVINNYAVTAHLLLLAGADIHIYKDCLLTLAVEKNNLNAAKILLQHGADPLTVYNGKTALEHAVQTQRTAFITLFNDHLRENRLPSRDFFEEKNISELRGSDAQGKSYFFVAAQAGCFDVITHKILDSAGERLTPQDLTAPVYHDQTILHVLGQQGHLSQAFNALLWLGHKNDALSLCFNAIPTGYKDQVDPNNISAEIDHATLKKNHPDKNPLGKNHGGKKPSL
jgi:ankyrin repeat protein